MTIHVIIVEEEEKHNLMRMYLLKFLRGLMMEQELELLEKVRQVQKEDQMVICIYSFQWNHMIFLKDLKKIFFMSCQSLLQMQH